MRIDQSSARAWVLASEAGCSIAFFIAAGVIGGVLLDKLLHTSPIFLLVGIFLGLGLAGYSLYRLLVFRPTRERRPGLPNEDDTEEPR